jgi:hypothetical protein
VDPYLNRGLNEFQRLALLSQFFTVFGGIMFQYLKILDKVLDQKATSDEANVIAYLIFILNLIAIAGYPIYLLFMQGNRFAQWVRATDLLLLPHVILSKLQWALPQLFQSEKRKAKEDEINVTEEAIKKEFEDFSKRGTDKESVRTLLERLENIYTPPLERLENIHTGRPLVQSAKNHRFLFLFSMCLSLLSLAHNYV